MKKEKLIQKASKIKLVITDSDGVLTDGGVYYSADGEMMKRFSIRDGMGIERLRKLANIETAIVTGELSGSVKKRAEKLSITELHLGIKNKIETLKEISARLKLKPEQVAYIGDDTNDLEVMKNVGLSACPNDAISFVKKIADYVCDQKGGHGAFRELAELIISCQKKI
jgi:3-deoxy-D-manno-octulosonate 8-phosphate phosphatase (KDO 8-P phosphatase)